MLRSNDCRLGRGRHTCVWEIPRASFPPPCLCDLLALPSMAALCVDSSIPFTSFHAAAEEPWCSHPETPAAWRPASCRVLACWLRSRSCEATWQARRARSRTGGRCTAVRRRTTRRPSICGASRQVSSLSVMRAVMGVPEGWSGRSGVRRRAGVGARAGPRAPGSRRTGCVHGKVRAPLRSAWTCFCCVARRRPWAPRAPGAVGAVAKPVLYDGLPPVRGECFGAYGRHAWPSRGLAAVPALVPDRRG